MREAENSGWAFLCGISQYESISDSLTFPSYKSLDNYVIRLINILLKEKSGFKKENIFALVSEPSKIKNVKKEKDKYYYEGIRLKESRRNTIITWFSAFLKKITEGEENDTILIYFICHGGSLKSGENLLFAKDSYFSDNDELILLETSLTIKSLEEQFQRQKTERSSKLQAITRNVFFIIDACREIDATLEKEKQPEKDKNRQNKDLESQLAEYEENLSAEHGKNLQKDHEISQRTEYVKNIGKARTASLGINVGVQGSIVKGFSLETEENYIGKFLKNFDSKLNFMHSETEPSGISYLYSCWDEQKAQILDKQKENERSVFSEALMEILEDKSMYPLKFGQIVAYTSIKTRKYQNPKPLVSDNGYNKIVMGIGQPSQEPSDVEIEEFKKTIKKDFEKWEQSDINAFVRNFLNINFIMSKLKVQSGFLKIVLDQTQLTKKNQEDKESIMKDLGKELLSEKLYLSGFEVYRKNGGLTEFVKSLYSNNDYNEINKLDEKERKVLGNLWYEIGITAVYEIEHNNINIARDAFEKTTQILPDHADAWNNLGEIYYYVDYKILESKQCFTNAIKFNPKHSVAWYNLGNLYIAEGLQTQAKGAYERAIEADKMTVPAVINYGLQLAKEGYNEKALEQLKEIKRLIEEKVPVLPATPRYNVNYYEALILYNLYFLEKDRAERKRIKTKLANILKSNKDEVFKDLAIP